MANQVELIFYDKKYFEVLNKIRLSEEQSRFTQSPGEAIDTLSDPNRRLILILCDDVCVGYFILHKNDGPAKFGFDNHALLIRSLAVNPSEQGKGLAFKGMSALPKFVETHFEEINKLVLVVNNKNKPAQKLYKKLGFVEHSSIQNEVHGLQWVYCLDL